MKILIIDHVQQSRNWVNAHKPRIYNRTRMSGVEDNKTQTEFKFVFHKDIMTFLRGFEIDQYANISRIDLSPEEESFLMSLVR